MVRKRDYPHWDYTHLYAHIHEALVNMKPYIIGDKSNLRRTYKGSRRFLEAVELSRRIRDGELVLGEHTMFVCETSSVFPSDAELRYKIHVLVGKYRKTSKPVPAILIIENQHAERLAYLIGRYSNYWWD